MLKQLTLFRRTAKYTVFDYTINKDILRELKTQLLSANKLQSTKINGYNILRESTDPYCLTLLRNDNQQEEENRTPH